jgi:hypothetical protein
MFTLRQGDCEHCVKRYNYDLWNAAFGDFSYAYCDFCGMLATLDHRHSDVAHLTSDSSQYQEIDAEWEPFIRPCECGGHFRKGASPRCPHCLARLSAEYAAVHIQRTSVGAPRGWRWQRNWTGPYCIAIEQPHHGGTMRHVIDPFLEPEAAIVDTHPGQIFKLDQ